MKFIYYLYMALISNLVLANDPPIRFDYTPEEITVLCETQKKDLEKSIDQISLTTNPSFENTLLKLEQITADFNRDLGPALFLKYTSINEKVRAAADKCETTVNQLFVDLFAREDLYQVVKKIPALGLNELDTKLLEEYLVGFQRNGLGLPAEKRKLFVEKKKRLVQLESEFANNLVNEKETLEVTLKELDGLPESFIQSLNKNENGLYVLTMAYPHYYPFMQNATNAQAREKFEKKFNLRGGEKNKALLEEAISIRDDLAKLLGFENHAAYILDRRMAKKTNTVRDFLTELASKLKSKGEENLKELLDVKKIDPEASDKHMIKASDWRYYDNYLRKTKFNVNNELIKEFFPIDIVLKGMFEVYETILSVQFKEEKNADVWHPSVKKYTIQKNNTPIAIFYMDLFPREGKYNHAAAFTLRSGQLRPDGKYQMPISSIVANFTAPIGSKPSLLLHSEVETLFHEFGHIMHQTLTRAQYPTFSGTSVKTDFVEAPSQMLENWVWEKEILQKLSGHYTDPSKKLPDEQIDKMIAAKNLNIGITYLRQVAFATLDLDYHTQKTVDSTQVYCDRMKEIMLIPCSEGSLPQASFGHLMGGYDAGYYGYLWSEVYAQDMFTRFQKEGLLNPQTGKDYLNWILEPGGTIDPFDLISKFLGRHPNSDAFLKSLGL